MNIIDELAQAARTALDKEYAGYDLAHGRARLEDEVISAAVTREDGDIVMPAQARPRDGERVWEDEPDGSPSAWVIDWSAQAACRTADPDEMFVQAAAQRRTKSLCSGCPVRTECLADALDNRVKFGVWGGMTERERRALLRRRPAVTSWRRLLETARTEYERSAGVVSFDEDLPVILEHAV